MSVIALGLNHATAPLDLRGRFAFAPEQLAGALQGFRERVSRAGRPEAALLSTCNRTELYFAADPGHSGELVRPAIEWLATQGSVSGEHMRDHTYVLEDRAAARHAFRVASGLDSMVLGEPQILGQMKEAVRHAESAGTLGSTLHQLFQRSFSVAKEVRSSTEIGSHSISMAAASVRLAAQLFEDLSKIRVLFVGAGEMVELTATHFAARRPQTMAVANRTLERGERLASRFGAQALRLAELPAVLHEYDVVVSCTASSLPIIGLGAVERALKARRHRPMFMVDLAVPRDIEPEAGELDDVFLYTVDDLAQIVSDNRDARRSAVDQAEVIIEMQVGQFMRWMQARENVPLIRALREQGEQARRQELERALRLLQRGDDPASVLEALSQGLTNKLLHAPTQALNQAAGEEGRALAEILSRLFRIK
jgi:glutamyl-tRNA reductase